MVGVASSGEFAHFRRSVYFQTRWPAVLPLCGAAARRAKNVPRRFCTLSTSFNICVARTTTMKIDVDKLIDQVSRHPEIYNPDHKDFADKEITENIFNNVVSKAVDGINGKRLIARTLDHVYAYYLARRGLLTI